MGVQNAMGGAEPVLHRTNRILPAGALLRLHMGFRLDPLTPYTLKLSRSRDSR